MDELLDDSLIIEAKESDYLFIQHSQLPESGNGLYTAIPIYKDETIAIFKGEIITKRQVQHRVNKEQDQYFISMLDGTILDSKKVKSYAKYANDAAAYANSAFKNNSKITADEANIVYLVATRNIKAGEEIFCSYGKLYWEKHG
jgi:SET domain-containing protein